MKVLSRFLRWANSVLFPVRKSREKNRERFRSVACPKCGVGAGSSCLGIVRKDGTRHQRKANHIERVKAYNESHLR